MATMKENVAKLVALANVTDKTEFPKTPRGYIQRLNASMIQLCLHTDPIVRTACATSPLLRDMFVIAMFENEQDAEIKTILEPRYLEACSKEHMRDTELEDLRGQVTTLQAALKARTRKRSK